jgi:hypothetical protein
MEARRHFRSRPSLRRRGLGNVMTPKPWPDPNIEILPEVWRLR